MLFALLTGCGATGCTQTQLDTLTECSMDIVSFGGLTFWRDINCTDASIEGFRDDQADALKAIRMEIRQHTKVIEATQAAKSPLHIEETLKNEKAD